MNTDCSPTPVTWIIKEIERLTKEYKELPELKELMGFYSPYLSKEPQFDVDAETILCYDYMLPVVIAEQWS